MIEINLVPDVKQELIRARRVRTVVVSVAIIVGVASIAVVVLLAFYLFAVQGVRSKLADDAIVARNADFTKVEDLDDTLTIQRQLAVISDLHAQKNIDSRFFDLLVAINPAAPNQVSFSLAKLDAEEQVIRLEGQAANGYIAADALKKTIERTTLEYRDGDKAVSAPLTKNVSMSELSYGEDATGKKVLRFSMTFEYDEAFFASTSDNATIIRPDRQNVTDSYQRLPESLFVNRASDEGGSE